MCYFLHLILVNLCIIIVRFFCFFRSVRSARQNEVMTPSSSWSLSWFRRLEKRTCDVGIARAAGQKCVRVCNKVKESAEFLSWAHVGKTGWGVDPRARQQVGWKKPADFCIKFSLFFCLSFFICLFVAIFSPPSYSIFRLFLILPLSLPLGSWPSFIKTDWRFRLLNPGIQCGSRGECEKR